MSFTRIVLLLSALPFAAIGAAFLVAPATMAGHVGLALSGAIADSDVRAVYGGLQLGCAAILLFAASKAESEWCRAGLVAQLLLYGGLAGARLVSYAFVGLPEPLGLLLHGGEILGLAAGVVAWRTLPRGKRGTGS